MDISEKQKTTMQCMQRHLVSGAAVNWVQRQVTTVSAIETKVHNIKSGIHRV